MKKEFLFFFMLASIALFLSVSSCDNSPDRDADEGPYKDAPIEQKTAFEPMTPVNYGNGVYYFTTTERQFGISLSAFLADTTKQLVSITGDGTGGAGYDLGYWVVVKEK